MNPSLISFFSPRGVVANIVDSDIIVNKFELQVTLLRSLSDY